MSGAVGLRSQDIRAVGRLIGECRELGGEPSRWHRHMLRGLGRLLGVLLVAGGEGLLAGPEAPIEFVSVYGESDDSAAVDILGAYHDADGPADDPTLHALTRIKAPGQITRTRRHLVADAVWYRSASFEQYRRPARIDQRAISIFPGPRGAISGISLHGVLGEPELAEPQVRLLELFHAQIGPMIGGPLLSDTEPGPESLSPRLGQTLACLLEGDSEKQVAARLGLSPATVHQYVTALYRHFRVRSRAQLLAHAMQRLSREPWRRLRTEIGAGESSGGSEPLSPRLRQTLACLLEGDSERQVAARLGLSHATVHQYVTALYRRFEVGSRAQLLARLARRAPPEPRAVLTG